MADLAVQKPTLTGTALTYAAASAAGDTFSNSGAAILHLKNGSAAAVTATIDSVQPCSHGFDHDIAATIPAGGERIIGPFAQARFGVTVSVAYSAVTSVTVAVVSV